MDAPTYSIARWDEHYENNRTRSMVVMQWIPVPNAHDGDGYIELVDRKNGAAYLGAWLAILQVASKCKERGKLLRSSGKPHTAKSIAKITRLDEKIISETLQLLATEDIAWMCQEPSTLPAVCPHPPRTQLTKKEGMEGREEKEGTEDHVGPLFDSPEMMAAWRTWKKHRGELKKKLTPTQIEKAVKKLKAWGDRRAIAAIDFSVANGWQGLFEEDSKGGKQNTSGYVRHDQPNNPDRSAF